jgi:hypothetical protein
LQQIAAPAVFPTNPEEESANPVVKTASTKILRTNFEISLRDIDYSFKIVIKANERWEGSSAKLGVKDVATIVVALSQCQ